MPNKLFKLLSAGARCIALTACAAPKQGPLFEHTASVLRAAKTAGAAEFAPEQLLQANQTYRKAEAMLQQRRSNRAQKLLELATAEANLALAMSEAAQAELALDYVRSANR